jgi:signal transduction histidine kinase
MSKPLAADGVGNGASTLHFLSGGGELGALIRAFDWRTTPLGPPGHWPQSLKTAVRIMLTSRQPIWIGWGQELTYLYNDPYKSIIGGKHPTALGQPASVVWREIWNDIGPMLDTVMTGFEGTYAEAKLLIMERHGYPEETYYTFSYSPVPNDDGSVGGIICANTDDTQRVIGERQLTLLRELAAGTANARTWEEACERSAEALETNPRDLPFAMIYVAAPESDTLELAGVAGIRRAHPAARNIVRLDAPLARPFGEALRQREVRLADASALFGADLPTGAWGTPPTEAAIIPIQAAGERGRAGLLVVGLNPYRRYDEGYRGFLDLAAGQIGTAIANAQAYEDERKRAEALAEIDRAKTAFFSNASHEFRTPLTLMLGPLEDCLARAGTGGAIPVPREDLALMHRNALRLLRLVNTLLDFSRLEAGRLEATYAPADLAALTADLASNFRSAIDRAGLRLTIDCPPLPQPVHVDRDLWEKIILNLMSNAFKFTFDGEIAVTVRPSADGRRAEISVRDTGTGIPAAELSHLFERFRRIEGARGRSFEGSGIGLALVQELAKLHGGDVRVESEMGRGSTFTVCLPFGTAHLPPDRIGAARTQPGTNVRAQAFVDEALGWLSAEAGAAGGEDRGAAIAEDLSEIAAAGRARGQVVLVADDNADMREYVARLLRSGGFDVRAAADGEAALALARDAKPALVLSDVMMPKLDGLGLLAALRRDPSLNSTPVILLSARAGTDASVDALRAGADDYIVKPFGARELLARVEATIRLSETRLEALRRERALNETLEQRVAEEIEERMKTEEVLRQAQKMEAIGQLTGGIAHDFNNLLQVILGNLESLRRRTNLETRADIKKPVETAIRGAERAAELTNQLLAFSRRQPLKPKPIELGRLVSGMSELLRRVLGETIATETVLAGGLWKAHADANQLESALLNLAVNARDAMPRGGKLTIETANVFLDEAYAATHDDVRSGQYVMIAVSDTGTGMSKEVLAKAFDPFFTTKEIGKGTGLGLSQVYGFVKQSGGHVKIYSEPGEGTTVKVYLPRVVADAEIVPPDVPPPAGDATEVILVVEDDGDVRANTIEMLRDLGYSVLAAADSTSALKILDATPNVHLLFTDVGLPGGFNGRQLADEAQRRRPALRVLFTTGYARNAIVHQGRLDPGVEMLPKPFTYATLAAKLRAVLHAKPDTAR